MPILLQLDIEGVNMFSVELLDRVSILVAREREREKERVSVTGTLSFDSWSQALKLQSM